MKTKILLAVMLLGSATLSPAATNELTSLLQQGLFDEEANRDLTAAIADYQSLATQFERDRSVAATAIYRLGECYRKLGQTNEAAVQYERLIRDFADQKDLVTLSRQNLTGLGAATASHLTQRLQPINPASPETKGREASQAEHDLLADEIKVVEQELAGQQQQVKVGSLTTDATLPTQQKLLELKRQLAALEAGEPVSPQPAMATTDAEALEIVGIQQMIQNSPDLINAPRDNGRTPLARAAINGWLKVAAYLLDHGANVNAGKDSGQNALFYAANAGNRAMTELLIRRGAEVNVNGSRMASPLSAAAESGYQAVVEVLLANKADVNARDSDGKTPLCRATTSGQVKIAQLLLAAGANPNAEIQLPPDMLGRRFGGMPNQETIDGRTPLSFAAESGSPDMVKLLLDAKADPNGGRLDAPLLCAIKNQDAASVEFLLQNGANANKEGQISWSFLIHNYRYSNGPFTPLWYAIMTDQFPIVQLLLKHQADPNAARDGRAVVFDALSDTNILKALLAAGAIPNVEDSQGRTPLSYAAESGSLVKVKLLLDAKGDPNGGKLDAPLFGAIAADDAATVELLLQAGAKANEQGTINWAATINNTSYNGAEVGVTPLWLAVWKNQLPLVQLLLKHQADPNDEKTDGRALAFNALANPDLLEALLTAGAKVEACDRRQTDNYGNNSARPLLNSAVDAKSAGSVEALLKHGANPNTPDGYGNTPLHVAAEVLAEPRIFELLLAAKANPNVRNHDAKTPLNILKEKAAPGLQNQPGLPGLPGFPGRPGGRGFPGGPVTYGANGAVVSLGGGGPYSEQPALTGRLADLLRQHGALDKLPDWDRITVSRPAANYSRWIFNKGTNDWNHFSLLELIYAMGNNPAFPSSPLAFADLAHITVVRPSPDGLTSKRIPVNLMDASNGVDGAKDVPLEFGDVVEIPEREHTLAEHANNLPDDQFEMIVNYLRNKAGNARLTVTGGRTIQLPLVANYSEISVVIVSDAAKGALTSNSDLARVKVTRHDPKTGKISEWMVDCSNIHQNQYNVSDLWLRDGDVIEVPEKP